MQRRCRARTLPAAWHREVLLEFSVATAAIGLFVGFFVGLTGVGGGVILAPVLVFMGVQPTVAVGTDLVYGTLTKLVATVRNVAARRVDWSWTWALALGSVPGGLIGSFLIQHLRDHHGGQADAIVKSALGVVLVLAAGLNLWTELSPYRRKNPGPLADWTPVGGAARTKVGLAGLVVGIMVGLTSVGSGSLVAMLLLAASRLDARRLIGTDIAHAMLLVAAASLAHLSIGTVDMGLALNLLAGSIPGVLVGTRLAGITPTRPLKLVVTGLVLVAGVKMLA